MTVGVCSMLIALLHYMDLCEFRQLQALNSILSPVLHYSHSAFSAKDHSVLLYGNK